MRATASVPPQLGARSQPTITPELKSQVPAAANAESDVDGPAPAITGAPRARENEEPIEIQRQ